MKTIFQNRKARAQYAFNSLKGHAGKAAVATGALAMSGLSHAAIDTSAVETALTSAESSAHTVATVVIGIVAGLAVVGIIIGLVKKL